ncbi:MAG: CHASE2 domain-containing protein [Spirulina sp. DLM2.Bin59]|nr:MAG: CHASE2 domain-containing protein [Spirulina sp. DLM2.Bin59]
MPSPLTNLGRKFRHSLTRPWGQNLMITGGVAGIVLLLRGVGLLQLGELATYDWLMRSRPPLPPDDRIVIVTFDEAEIRTLNWPFSDAEVAQLLTVIKNQNPQVIGLDIYRDVPVKEGYDQLKTILQSTPNLIGIRKAIPKLATLEEFGSGRTIDPPPDLPPEQVGFNDFPDDIDGLVRRLLLTVYLEETDESLISFGFLVAWQYLKNTAGLEPQNGPNDTIQLGDTIFSPIEAFDGGYHNADTQGYSIFLNYRGPDQGGKPDEAYEFQRVSWQAVIDGEIAPDLFRDRIVLIGSVAPSLQDFIPTPYHNPQQMSGVVAHANAISFLIDAALGKRQPIRTIPDPVEWLLILLGAVVGTVAITHWRTVEGLTRPAIARTMVQFGGAIALLILGSYGAFLLSWWLPLLPVLLTLTAGAGLKFAITMLIYLLQSYRQIEDYARTLELKVAARTEELSAANQSLDEKNNQLETTLVKLQTAQAQIIAQERLASLGSLTAGVAHEIRNPLNFVINFARISEELTTELGEELADLELALESQDTIDDIVEEFKENLGTIRDNGQRIEQIVDSMLEHTREGGGQAEMTDLNQLLRDVVELVEHNLRAKMPDLQVKKAITLNPDCPALPLVAKDFTKAMINILTNAFEAMERRRGQDPDYQPQLAVNSWQQGGRIGITVRDNGDGILPEHQPKIFDPFFTTKPTGEGTGLGLSLAHQTLVSVHQGNIVVESVPGEFTEFRIDLDPRGGASLLAGVGL